MSDRYQSIFKQDNVAVITGGASGIGLAAAREFAKCGMNICLADKDSQRLKEAAQLLVPLCDQRQERIMTFELDVTHYDQLEGLKTAVYERFGKVNVLMNNAGIAAPSSSWNDMEGWRGLLEVNLFGVIHGVQAFSQAMIDQKSPAMIINTGSKQGITNPPGLLYWWPQRYPQGWRSTFQRGDEPLFERVLLLYSNSNAPCRDESI